MKSGIKNEVFYFVCGERVRECVVVDSKKEDMTYVKFLDEDWGGFAAIHPVIKDHLFKTKTDAEEAIRRISMLYTGFDRKPRVSLYTLEKYRNVMLGIQYRIIKELRVYHNLIGMDFFSTFPNFIYIRGFHKDIIFGYAYNISPPIRDDFSNKEEAVERFIESWKENDNKVGISIFNSIINECQEYSFD